MGSRRPILAALLMLTVVAPLGADVRLLRVPAGGRVPSAVLDRDGVLHVTYGTQSPGNAFYVQSRDGKTWSTPVQVNRRADTVTCGMERGPLVALGKDGVIHVVWAGHYQRGGGVWFTRSTDGGRSFAPEKKLNEPDYGLDNLALAADARGRVVVLWTGGFPGIVRESDSPAASAIVLVKSSDNGQSFSRNELLRSDSPVTSYACGCCRLEARLGPQGQLYVGLRGGYKSLRDPWFLVGSFAENQFRAVKISDDQWLTTCPMQGVPFQVDDKGRAVVAWMSRNQAFWSTAEPGLKSFGKRSAASDPKEKASFPLALALPEGRVYVQWQTPAGLRWRIDRIDGTPTDEQGTLRLADTTKATALVDRAGAIVVVY